MAVNFSNEKLVKISCDKICDDNHDVQNLISSNDIDRRKGFLVEYYIRPPVTVKVEFLIHNFDLMYIELGLKVRQHQVRGVEVYTQTDSDCNQMIAKYFNITEKLIIINNCYTPSRHLPKISFSESAKFYVAGRNIKYCNNIKYIFLKIFSTINSTVPCLR